MSKFCANCGSPLNDEARFCGNCGSPCGGASEHSAPAGPSPYEAPVQPEQPAESVPYATPLQPEQSADSVPYAAAAQSAQPSGCGADAPQQYNYSQNGQQAQPAQYPAYSPYGAQNAQQYPQYPQYQPVQPQKKSHKGCLIAVIIAVVVIVGLIIAAAIGFSQIGDEIKTQLENEGILTEVDESGMKASKDAGNSTPEAVISTFLKQTEDFANGVGNINTYIECFYEYKFIKEEYKDIMADNFESIGEYFAEEFESEDGNITISYKVIETEDYTDEEMAETLDDSDIDLISDITDVEAMCVCTCTLSVNSDDYVDEDVDFLCIKKDGKWYISAVYL